MNYTNEQIYLQYCESKLLNELAPKFIDNYNSKPDILDKRGKLLLMYGYNDSNEIDTIYEVYINDHTFDRAFNRSNYKRISYNEIIKNIDAILECTPIELLNTPQNSARHITFDVYNTDTSAKNDIVQLACIVSAAKPTKLTSLLKQRYKNVIVCDIITKSIIALELPQFCKTDITNNAIHIPIALNKSIISLDYTDFIVRCDCNQINNKMKKLISAYRMSDNNPDIIIYPYVEFFQTLEDIHAIKYPKGIDIYTTLGKHSNVDMFDSIEDALSHLKSTGYTYDIKKSPIPYYPTKNKSKTNMKQYRGGKSVDKYEGVHKNNIFKDIKHKPIPRKYNTPADAAIDYIDSLRG